MPSVSRLDRAQPVMNARDLFCDRPQLLSSVTRQSPIVATSSAVSQAFEVPRENRWELGLKTWPGQDKAQVGERRSEVWHEVGPRQWSVELASMGVLS